MYIQIDTHTKAKWVGDQVISCLLLFCLQVPFLFFLIFISTSQRLLCYSTFHSLEIEKVSGPQFVTGWSVVRIFLQLSTASVLGLAPSFVSFCVPRSSEFNGEMSLLFCPHIDGCSGALCAT